MLLEEPCFVGGDGRKAGMGAHGSGGSDTPDPWTYDEALKPARQERMEDGKGQKVRVYAPR